jgi:hypothetical protein
MIMKITNAKFTASGSITALVDGVEMTIPVDSGNRHYVALLGQGIMPEPYVEPAPTRAQQEALRQATYASEADPIAMQMLRDEATKEEWLAKIDEIKARYPYPEEPAQ